MFQLAAYAPRGCRHYIKRFDYTNSVLGSGNAAFGAEPEIRCLPARKRGSAAYAFQDKGRHYFVLEDRTTALEVGIGRMAE